MGNSFKILLFIICSSIFSSCSAITSQNIKYVKPNQQLYVNKGLENKFINQMNADQIGRIISVEGNSIRIELVNQVKNNYNYSGIIILLTVDNDTKISKTTVKLKDKKQQLEVALKLSDLKKDQLIFIWYKENDKVVEKISIFGVK